MSVNIYIYVCVFIYVEDLHLYMGFAGYKWFINHSEDGCAYKKTREGRREIHPQKGGQQKFRCNLFLRDFTRKNGGVDLGILQQEIC